MCLKESCKGKDRDNFRAQDKLVTLVALVHLTFIMIINITEVHPVILITFINTVKIIVKEETVV